MNAYAPRKAWLIVCHHCRLQHPCAPGSAEAAEFFARHEGHHVETAPASAQISILQRLTGADLFRSLGRRDGGESFAFDRMGVAGYAGNANVKQAFGSVTSFTITNANLASSPTAGWKSAAVDNSANLYADAIVKTRLAAVNTAPANSKAIFQYAHGVVDDAGTAYDSTGDGTPDGSEGTIAFPDVTANAIPAPLLGVIPYPVQNKAINSPPASVAACFGGILPPKWLVTMINHSGMTLSVTSIQWRGVYWTVI